MFAKKKRKMKKKLLITVVCSVAIALFFVGQKQSSLNVLVRDNVEALSDNDIDLITATFGKLRQNTLMEYPKSNTPISWLAYWFATQSSEICYHPYCPEYPGKMCGDPVICNTHAIRDGIYCYTIEFD